MTATQALRSCAVCDASLLFARLHSIPPFFVLPAPRPQAYGDHELEFDEGAEDDEELDQVGCRAMPASIFSLEHLILQEAGGAVQDLRH